jgi:hypothetical protein
MDGREIPCDKSDPEYISPLLEIIDTLHFTRGTP